MEFCERVISKLSKTISVAMLGLLFAGCSTTFGERHYMMTSDPETGEIINVFRLNVQGGSDNANARYIAGYFDERAVDLFFNEVHAQDYAVDRTDNKLSGVDSMFNYCSDPNDPTTCIGNKKKDLNLSPLGSDGDEGNSSFVMILSTNADAIAETIGGFAENATIQQSLYRIINKDTFQKKAELDALSANRTLEMNALISELDVYMEVAKADANAGTSEYLTILSALANGLSDGAPPLFDSIDQASGWFASADLEQR